MRQPTIDEFIENIEGVFDLARNDLALEGERFTFPTNDVREMITETLCEWLEDQDGPEEWNIPTAVVDRLTAQIESAVVDDVLGWSEANFRQPDEFNYWIKELEGACDPWKRQVAG